MYSFTLKLQRMIMYCNSGFIIRGKKVMERETGLEPATTCLEGRDSTTELLPLALVTGKFYAITK